MDDKFAKLMEKYFTERERILIANCVAYVDGNPAGLPGHNLMIIIEKLLVIAEYGYNLLDKDAKRKLDDFSESEAREA